MKKLIFVLVNTVIFLLSIVSWNAIANFEPSDKDKTEAKINMITFDNRKIVAGGQMVVTLLGQNLHLIDKINIYQKNAPVGRAALEKYTTNNSSERRVVITFGDNLKTGTVKLSAKSNLRVLIPTHRIQ